jgi:hypothetical protein
MRYLVQANVKAACKENLLKAIQNETLGQGSVAEGEYLRNMRDARVGDDGEVRWVEVCYCPTPLQEERSYWEDILTSPGLRMRTTGGNAGTKMAANPGHAGIATAQHGWRRS